LRAVELGLNYDVFCRARLKKLFRAIKKFSHANKIKRIKQLQFNSVWSNKQIVKAIHKIRKYAS